MPEPVLFVGARRLRAARGVVVARDVSLTAARGDVVAVEGPNGSGKSTLLAAAAGLLPAGRSSARPSSVGYSPERSGALPRMALHRWLTGLARASGLSRGESARRAGDLLDRLGLAHAAQVPLQALSRGNAQRALVAQALIADPDLLVLDEPSGGLDRDGVARVAAEIERAAARRAVVLVARHPTAPLPLPPGMTWRLRDGSVEAAPRRESVPRGTVEVETGDGVVTRVPEAELPAVLRAALDAGQAIRRVQPADYALAGTAGVPEGTLRRAPLPSRVLSGAVHRARLLASAQWFLAPLLLFLALLAIVYATDAGPPLQAAAVTAVALAPVMTWLSVLAHRVDGRELARAFAAHLGGRGRAHLATDLGLAPFALAAAAAALAWPLATQGAQRHSGAVDAKILGLHLAAAVFGAGAGSLLALMQRAGWRLLAAVALYLVLFAARRTPLAPLLRMSTHPVTAAASIAGPVAWLCLPGLALAAAAAFLTGRLA